MGDETSAEFRSVVPRWKREEILVILDKDIPPEMANAVTDIV